MIGTTIGHYRILDRLGKGGMGEVYLAEDLKLGRRVALKVLPRDLVTDGTWRPRFEREARAVAALNHPNIVTLHAIEDIDGVAFFTLELVEGKTLAELVPQGGLPLDRLLTYAIPLADAVGAAHQRGITHRDLKPLNVMVGHDGRVKVLDFGLAKVAEQELADQGMTSPATELTGAGRILGTTAYMSPEQAEGRAVDPRSDVFSLGVMLYEMATGERPFKGDTQVSLLSAIIKDTPKPLTDLKQELPRDIARIVKRCLAKDPEDRYQTAKDLRNDLRALKTDMDSGDLQLASGPATPIARPAASAGRRSAPTLAIVGVLAVGALAAGGYWLARRPGAATTSPPAAAAGDAFTSVALNRLTSTGTAGISAMSDDGRYVAYVVVEDGKEGLWLRQTATSSNVSIVPAQDARYSGVAFSPDGNYVYYSYYPRGENFGALYQVPVLGGGARRLIEDVDGTVSFSPDGKRFAFLRGLVDSGGAEIIVADASSMAVRVLASRKGPATYPLLSLSWSPDGRTIAVPGTQEGRLHGELVFVDAESGKERVLDTPDWRAVTHVAWMPDGKGLLVNAQESTGEQSSQIWYMAYPEGTTQRVTSDLSTYTGLSLSKDGRSFVSVRNELRARVYVVPDGDVKHAQPLTTGAGTDDGVPGIAWTPDGRLVYASSAGGDMDIWIMNADGSGRVQLTTTKGNDVAPRVTPDGTTVVYVSEGEGTAGLWRMDIDGGRPRRLVEGAVAYRPVLSANGTTVYYSDRKRQNYRVSIEGGTPEKLSDLLTAPPDGAAPALPKGFHEPAPSPDGKWIAGHYIDDSQRGERTALLALGRAEAPRLLKDVRVPVQWTSDSRGLLYVDTRQGVSNIWRRALDAQAGSQVTAFTNDRIFSYALAPDQRQWVIVRGEVSADVVLVAERH
jgi:Tol biopolymer transport system component